MRRRMRMVAAAIDNSVEPGDIRDAPVVRIRLSVSRMSQFEQDKGARIPSLRLEFKVREERAVCWKDVYVVDVVSSTAALRRTEPPKCIASHRMLISPPRHHAQTRHQIHRILKALVGHGLHACKRIVDGFSRNGPR
ncbi:hypothetical protein ABW21_db0200210 [Orbilia brochopaga]|nr:hypothetical protein ABW21_db0200210 [Drechslerella brochopaga]